MKSVILILAIHFCSFLLAQTTDTPVEDTTVISNSGIEHSGIRVFKDPRIDQMVVTQKKSSTTTTTTTVTVIDEVEGYRVQIFYDAGNKAKDQALLVKRKFLEKYPQYGAYLNYQTPNFKLLVGDFKSAQEASSFQHLIRRDFPESITVRDAIKFVPLKVVPKEKDKETTTSTTTTTTTNNKPKKNTPPKKKPIK